MNDFINKLNEKNVFFPAKAFYRIIGLLLGDRVSSMLIAMGIGVFFLSVIPIGQLVPIPFFSVLVLVYWVIGVNLGYQERFTVDNKGVLGKARFTTDKELLEKGLVSENGIVFGLDTRNRLISKPPNLDGHCLFVGGSGTGKSSAHAIPTLLNWKGTGLVVDIKGELSKTTAHLHDSIVFSTEEMLARYNPLAFIDSINDVQDLARTLFPTPKTGDTFWALSAQAVFSSAAWKYKDSKTFGEICGYLCIQANDEIISDLLDEDNSISRMLINSVANLKPETIGSVLAEMRTKIMPFAVDQNLQYATSESDFEPKSIENKMIYLKISEKQLAQYGTLLAVIVSQFISYMTTRSEKQQPPVLVLLDEFPRLGEMSKIVEGLATLRSRNVHLVLMIQSLAQLDDIYGRDKRRVIVDNCGYSLVLNAKDTETQKYFSELGGSKSAVVKSVSRGSSKSTTVSEQSVPLIRPEEFATLEKPILFGFKAQPVPLKQAFYYENKSMLAKIEG